MLHIRSRGAVTSVVVIAAALLASYLLTIVSNTPLASSRLNIVFEEVENVNEVHIVRLLDYLRGRGLKISGDASADRALVDKIVSTTRGEWDRYLNRSASPEAAALGIVSGQPIYILIVRGEVDRSIGPGLPNPNVVTPTLFDNIYVMFEPTTGVSLGTTSFYPGQPLPFYPEGTVAGGTPAQYKTPPEGDVLPVPGT